MGSNCENASWTMYQPAVGPYGEEVPPNQLLYPQRERLMSRVHTRGALGEVLHFFYNVTTEGYVLSANVSASLWASISRQSVEECDGTLTAPLWWAACTQEDSVSTVVHVTPDAYDPAMPRQLAANGTVTEIYLPRSISSNASASNAVLLTTVFWPDGSRSAYFRPKGPGVYSIVVPPLPAFTTDPVPHTPTADTLSIAAHLAATLGRDVLTKLSGIVLGGIQAAGFTLG